MTPLPRGLPIAIDAQVATSSEGTLAGGVPRRVMRLSDAGMVAVHALRRGEAAEVAARELGRRLVDAGLAHPCPPPRAVVQDVTVVVPVRDRASSLACCLAGVGPGTPIVVVDDGSRDPASVAAVADRHGAVLVRRAQSGGPGVARNAGLEHVHTPLVAFIDSDCVPPADWLLRLLGHFEDPLVVAVAPRVQPVRDERAGVVGRYLEVRSPLDMGPVPSAVGCRESRSLRADRRAAGSPRRMW